MSFPIPTRVTLIGLGALGILYASHMSEHKNLCTLVCLADRDRQERYRREGIFVGEKALSLNFAAPDEKPEAPANLVMVAVKGTGLARAVDDLRHHVGPDTTIISLLNGVTSEDVLRAAFPEATVLYCVAQGMDAMRVNHVLTFNKEGELVIGTDKPEFEPKVKELLDFFASVNIVGREDKHIVHRLYAKWMMNVGFNQAITYFRGKNADVQRPGEARDMLKAAMREVIAVANARGVDLSEKDLEEYVALGDSLSPESIPSMRQDDLAGRPTEVEMFAGTVLAMGKKYGIATPVNQKLYDELVKRC